MLAVAFQGVGVEGGHGDLHALGYSPVSPHARRTVLAWTIRPQAPAHTRVYPLPSPPTTCRPQTPLRPTAPPGLSRPLAPGACTPCCSPLLPLAQPFPPPTTPPTPTPNPQVQESALTDARDMIPAPRLDRHVFVRLLRDAGHVAVDAE